MHSSTDKILQEIKAEQNRRANLTKDDLQQTYRELEELNFPTARRLKFIADLGACKEIAFHYQLICKDWEDDKQLHLESSFDKHGKEGLDFLFEQLDKVEHVRLRIFTAYLLSETLSKLRHQDYYSSFCNHFLPVLISLVDTDDDVLRRKVIIALGWIGSSKGIDVLTRLMLNDTDALCRAWSASSLMQMSFHGVEQELLRGKTKPVFVQALAEEADFHTCGMMIEAAQILFGKKWIASSAVANHELDKIDKAKKSAIRFLSKS